MKKLLPKTVNNPQGFTLVELLIAISILAILSMIGIVGFTTVQQNARDSKRKADIDAIAAAMEANYVTGTGYQTAVSTGWFAGNASPTNPSPGGTTYNSSIATNNTGFMFCAKLEQSNGNSATSTGSTFTSTSGQIYYCRTNSQ